MALPKLDTPRYEMIVPSTGNKVVYRPYLVKEEKILMLAMESNDQGQMIRALKDVIRSCTEDTLDTETLALFDLEYIILKLRGKSVGETTEVGLSCKSCEARNDVPVDLESVKVDVPPKSKRKIKLTDKIGIMMKYPSVNTVIDADMSADNMSVDKVFDVIVSCIDSIYSNDEIFDASEQSAEELKEFLESLNTEQFSKVKKFIEEMPTATMTIDFVCGKCSEQNTQEVRGLGNFFG